MSIDTKRLAKDRAYWDEVAPLGATHCQPQQHRFYRRVEEDDWRVWSKMFDDIYYWFNSPGTSDDALWVIRPDAPEEWIDGLPPVGVECEFRIGGGNTKWHPCTVRYVLAGDSHEDADGWRAVVWCPHLGKDQVAHLPRFELRPIGTPEERERDEVVETAHAIIVDARADSTLDDVLQSLYDAGMLKRNES